jgi:hypothetical protein
MFLDNSCIMSCGLTLPMSGCKVLNTKSVISLKPDVYRTLCVPGLTCLCGAIASRASQLYPEDYTELRNRMLNLCRTNQFCSQGSRYY